MMWMLIPKIRIYERLDRDPLSTVRRRIGERHCDRSDATRFLTANYRAMLQNKKIILCNEGPQIDHV